MNCEQYRKFVKLIEKREKQEKVWETPNWSLPVSNLVAELGEHESVCKSCGVWAQKHVHNTLRAEYRRRRISK